MFQPLLGEQRNIWSQFQCLKTYFQHWHSIRVATRREGRSANLRLPTRRRSRRRRRNRRTRTTTNPGALPAAWLLRGSLGQRTTQGSSSSSSSGRVGALWNTAVQWCVFPRFWRGRPGACQGGQCENPPDRYQVLWREAQLVSSVELLHCVTNISLFQVRHQGWWWLRYLLET